MTLFTKAILEVAVVITIKGIFEVNRLWFFPLMLLNNLMVIDSKSIVFYYCRNLALIHLDLLF
jgi:hypothetical protein